MEICYGFNNDQRWERAIGKMDHLHLFTDGSVHPQSQMGYGAYLVVSKLEKPVESLKECVKVRRFEPTNSTKLELQTILWALASDDTIAQAKNCGIVLTAYTDSQNIVGLPGRRLNLEKRNYFSRNNTRLKNYELYQKFYQLTDQFNCQFIKVKGHKASRQKDEVDQLFSMVDQVARQALRQEFHCPPT